MQESSHKKHTNVTIIYLLEWHLSPTMWFISKYNHILIFNWRIKDTIIQHQKSERVVPKLYYLFLWRGNNRLKSHRGEREPKLKKEGHKLLLHKLLGSSRAVLWALSLSHEGWVTHILYVISQSMVYCILTS